MTILRWLLMESFIWNGMSALIGCLSLFVFVLTSFLVLVHESCKPAALRSGSMVTTMMALQFLVFVLLHPIGSLSCSLGVVSRLPDLATWSVAVARSMLGMTVELLACGLVAMATQRVCQRRLAAPCWLLAACGTAICAWLLICSFSLVVVAANTPSGILQGVQSVR